MSSALSPREMLERLVAFPTVSTRSNLDLIDFVEDFLAGHGVATFRVPDATGEKAALVGLAGPEVAGGVVLSGHTDVVPVDGQAWDTDPFTATLRDGRIYGRGSADMKSFIATALAMSPRFLAAPLKAPVHFALSYDEEVGCLGVRGLLAELARQDIRPGGCIIGEPTSMQPVIAHKGKRAYRCCVRGREAHSALTPQGVNAIEYAAKLVVHVRHIADRMRELETRDNRYDVPFTTLQTGVIRGGTAGNIVPRDCEVHFEFRYLPGVDPDALEREIQDYARQVLEPEMRRVAPEAGFTFETKAEIPAMDTKDEDRITALAQALAKRGDASKVAYATEGGLFQRAGIPSIICGPGSIEQAHKPNEYIALEQVAMCESFMDRLLEEMCR
jgi:acetylornithine deacetylase